MNYSFLKPKPRTAAGLLLFAIAFSSCQKDTNSPALPPTVDAGNSQTVQLPTTTFTLSGTATSSNGGIKTYQWSLISGPNVPIMATPGASSTVIAGFIKGTYLFQLVATDKAGLSGSDTTTVIVRNDYIIFTLSPPVVDAGNSQAIQMPASSFTLNGTATSSNGSIRAYLWSLVSGPNVPTINSPGLRTTTVSNFIPGNYIFQFMAIDSAGLTGVDTTSVQVIASPIQTLTLQPTNNPDERHLFGNATMDQSGHAVEIDAGTWTTGGIVVYLRALFKFDLSSIPANATILSAKLTLYTNPTPINGDHTNANSGPDNSMFIRRVASNWIPATTTWQNQPPSAALDQVSIPTTNLPFLDLVDVDVKNLVTDMRSSGNYGFVIMLQNENIYNIRVFCSSIYPDATKHPKLVITYQ